MRLLENTLRACASLGLSAVMVVAAPATQPAPAWDTVSFQAVVRGTSTLHDWSVESTRVAGEFQPTAGTVKGSLRIAAKSLTGGPSGLNGKMYAALKAEAHPTILFEASGVAWPAVPVDSGVTQDWPLRGWLTLAGTRREFPLVCQVTKQPDGQLVIETKLELMLTDFGIKPPTFMGFVRTGDAATVQVRWVLRAASVPVALR